MIKKDISNFFCCSIRNKDLVKNCVLLIKRVSRKLKRDYILI